MRGEAEELVWRKPYAAIEQWKKAKGSKQKLSSFRLLPGAFCLRFAYCPLKIAPIVLGCGHEQQHR